MTGHTWLIPVQPASTDLELTLQVLDDRSVTHTTVSPNRVRELLDAETPDAAIIHGGVLQLQLFEVQRWLAEFRVPTLVLVQELTDHFEASLLDRGAHDVVGVPTSARKLGSRLEALVRPRHVVPPDPGKPAMVSAAGSIEIHPLQRTVAVDRNHVELTKSEFDLLLALALKQGDVLTRAELAKAAGKTQLSDRALESHISRMRTKLRGAGAPDCIDSVRSIGYRLQAPNDAETGPQPPLRASWSARGRRVNRPNQDLELH